MPDNPGRAGFFGLRQLVGAFLLVAVIGTVGLLIGVSRYAAARGELVAATQAAGERFETVFREASGAKQQALRLGVEILARDELVANALRQRDRADLAARTVPIFEQILRPRFGATVLDFPAADGVMFFRAHRPPLFGDDASSRPMVAATLKSRVASSGLEIGRSGPELRAMTPVIVGDELVGAAEIGSSVDEPLQTAFRATGLDYGFAVDRREVEVADELRGAALLARGDLLFLKVSRPETVRTLGSGPTDIAAGEPRVVTSEERSLFLQSFALEDVARRPVTRIVLVRDLTEVLSDRRRDVALATGIGTLLAVALALAGFLQFGNLRTRLERTMSGRVREMREKAAGYDRVSGALRDVQAWKVGFVNEVAVLVKDPLAAIRGAIEDETREDGTRRAGHAAGERPALAVALTETRRLSAAVDDHVAMTAARDGLVRFAPERVDLAALARMLADGSDPTAPVLSAVEPAELPVSGSTVLLGAALRTLAVSVQRRSTAATVVIGAAPDGSGVAGRVLGEGRWTAAPPTLDEAATFVSALGGADTGASLLLARQTFERFGGTLSVVEEPGIVGYAFRLRSPE